MLDVYFLSLDSRETDNVLNNVIAVLALLFGLGFFIRDFFWVLGLDPTLHGDRSYWMENINYMRYTLDKNMTFSTILETLRIEKNIR